MVALRDTPGTHSTDGSATQPSRVLRQFFEVNLGRWTDFYKNKDIYAGIYQERHATALRYAEALKLRDGSFVLDAGCGPGFASTVLAQRGCVVHALDFLHQMAATTAELGRKADAGDRVRPIVGDAMQLPFAGGTFDLVVVLGVTEWVSPLDMLISEVARVLKPGGYLIIAWVNQWGLQLILNPTANPLFARLKRSVRLFLEKRGWIALPPLEYRYSLKTLETVFRNHGLTRVRARGIGFGPLPILWWRLPEALGHKINCALQRAADTRMPRLQSVARNYVAVARKAAAAY